MAQVALRGAASLEFEPCLPRQVRPSRPSMSSAPPTRLQPDGIDLIASQRKAIDEALASDRSVTPTSLVGGDRAAIEVAVAAKYPAPTPSVQSPPDARSPRSS